MTRQARNGRKQMLPKHMRERQHRYVYRFQCNGESMMENRCMFNRFLWLPCALRFLNYHDLQTCTYLFINLVLLRKYSLLNFINIILV
jgi:hypothetical protein